eukprot:403362242
MLQNLFTGVSSMIFGGQSRQYQLNNYTLIEDQLLAEGGYGYVYQVHELNNPQQKYALKRIKILDGKLSKMVKMEVKVWSKLGSHPNIVKYIDSQILENSDGSKDMLILSELCTNGTLVDYIEKKDNVLLEIEIISIMKQVVQGVKHMHLKGIAHRDLKIENIMFGSEGIAMLLDFGSASSDFLDLKTATKLEISKAMESYEKFTTLTYRPPEMMDQYAEHTVDLKVDIWMLGCILYTICFARHPFQDAQKLAILNAHYNMISDEPKYEHISEKMKDLIRLLLTPNPAKRPSIWDLELLLEQFDKLPSIDLNEEAQQVKLRHLANEETTKKRHFSIQNQQKPQNPLPSQSAGIQPKINQAQLEKQDSTEMQFEWPNNIEQELSKNTFSTQDTQYNWDADWSKDYQNQITQTQTNTQVNLNPFDEFIDEKQLQNKLSDLQESAQNVNQQQNQQQVSYNPFDFINSMLSNITDKFEKPKQEEGNDHTQKHESWFESLTSNRIKKDNETQNGKIKLKKFQDSNGDSWASWNPDQNQDNNNNKFDDQEDSTKIVINEDDYDDQEEMKLDQIASASKLKRKSMSHQQKREKDLESLEDLNDDEEKTSQNMFDQISALKNQKRKIPNQSRKSKSDKFSARGWCSNLNTSSQRDRQNICTRTSDIITKFREFMQNS